MGRSTWKRREFLRVAGAASLIGSASVAVEAEAPPETSTLRLAQIAGNCYAPQYVAESLLAAEGFSDLRYVRVAGSGQLYPALAAGEIDLTLAFLAPSIVQIDADASIVMLAGGHPGCLELFGSERIREIRDLKGKAVAVQALGSAGHVFIASMLAHVGIDAQRDVRWTVLPNDESLRQLAEGRVDAFMSGPPSSYEFRAAIAGRLRRCWRSHGWRAGVPRARGCWCRGRRLSEWRAARVLLPPGGARRTHDCPSACSNYIAPTAGRSSCSRPHARPCARGIRMTTAART